MLKERLHEKVKLYFFLKRFMFVCVECDNEVGEESHSVECSEERVLNENGKRRMWLILEF